MKYFSIDDTNKIMLLNCYNKINGFFVSLLASICGILLGRYFIGAVFLGLEMSFFEVPTGVPIINNSNYVVAALVIIVVSFITYLTCYKSLCKNPVETLCTELPKVKNGSLNITTKGIFKKLSFSSKWNLRDVIRNKFSTITGVVGIVGCCTLIVCAFGMLNSMNHFVKLQFDDLYNFDYKLTLKSDIKSEELENLENKYGNATSETLGIEIKDANGDKISWHIYGDQTYYESEIVGFNKDPQNQNLTMTREYMESLNLSYQPDSLYTNSNLKDIKDIKGVEVVQDIASLKTSMESMLSMMKTMITLIICFAILLGAVIIYNMGILSYSEKQYQFATLKVLGFKDKRIKKIFIEQNIWIAFASIIIGLPSGYFLTSWLFKQCLDDNFDFNVHINISTYLIATIGTFLVAYLVSKLLAKKINKIDMVSSLKGNE